MSNAGRRVARPRRHPHCVVIAGPNGAGKTTFAREYLARDAHAIHFINADLIAAGLSPLAPERAALSAARLMLAEIDRLTAAREDFAFESTRSGRAYVSRLERLKSSGYHLEIVFLRVASTRLALKRIAARVRQGGHPVPKADVLRRFKRGLQNFESVYRPLADAWAVYENSGVKPILLEQGP
jgi:predicted ABC-type ATPase